ncbi:hypothetical protein [Burkholderia stagnalis]|uniref:hypothetical protein n=1 Tax=Burkholderia stagnalis TaxID=1503054 RepID=UPI000759F2E2|nr:hypothetical protein [Burkholderia stagnalis]KVL85362.1 hypothetical protein WT03_29700 [Burkholderia stagnalis]KVL92010.1 hypothetical protein WT02_21080 [Burkholderia stagnalis]KVM06149.1 hypothetical protein WT04_24975 [Burkholderia stagnalis]
MKRILLAIGMASLVVAIGILGSVLPGVLFPIAPLNDGNAFGSEVGHRIDIAIVFSLIGIGCAGLSKVLPQRRAE